MIYFIVTGGHKYCLDGLYDLDDGPDFKVLSYKSLFQAKTLRPAVYVFCDFDRLDFWQTELSAIVFRQLQASGATVLNDPARALQRFALLRNLETAGLNSFKVWDAASDPLPEVYPVFLRTRHAHRGVLTEKLETRNEAEAALEKLLDEGFGLHDLVFIEYRAEPLSSGIFRKLSAFKIGDEIVTGLCVHDSNWQAKYGEEGIASEAEYIAEYEMIASNRYRAEIDERFKVANIEYGRADFAVVNGQIEVYEINTNPHLTSFEEHPSDTRLKSVELFNAKLSKAFKGLQAPTETNRIALNHPHLQTQRKHDRLVTKHSWKP